MKTLETLTRFRFELVELGVQNPNVFPEIFSIQNQTVAQQVVTRKRKVTCQFAILKIYKVVLHNVIHQANFLLNTQTVTSQQFPWF